MTPSGPIDGDEVAGVPDERSEPGFAAPAVDLFRQLLTIDCERHERRERPQRGANRLEHPTAVRGGEQGVVHVGLPPRVL